jgi:pimeloyl-ACP methyl ester carboxylesterase
VARRSPFLLVHGALHGAWCWDLLVRELAKHDRHAIAVELPTEDVRAGCQEYAEVAAETARAAGADRVHVVGHSLGGLVKPLLEPLIGVDELVFMSCPLPVPGRTLWEQLAREPDIFVAGAVRPAAREAAGLLEPNEEHAMRTYFRDCPAGVASWAATRLRVQSTRPMSERYPQISWPPRVRCRYIVGLSDPVLNPRWARREVPGRLGVDPIELDAGHSPFLAAPEALADVLVNT